MYACTAFRQGSRLQHATQMTFSSPGLARGFPLQTSFAWPSRQRLPNSFILQVTGRCKSSKSKRPAKPSINAIRSNPDMPNPEPKWTAENPYKPSYKLPDKETNEKNLAYLRKVPLDHLWKRRKLPLIGAAIVASLTGFYIFGCITASWRASSDFDGSQISPDTTPTGRPPAMSSVGQVECFDKELEIPETWTGIENQRRKMAKKAHGHVLEVAVGTGRNFKFYNWQTLTDMVDKARDVERERTEEGYVSKMKQWPIKKGGVETFTGLDISVDMLDLARKRLGELVPPMKDYAPIVQAASIHTGGQLSFLSDRLRLVNSDAHRPLPPPSSRATTSDTKYDTILQTFGLCSVSDPVAVLQNLSTMVRPETGRILLLEHGKGWLGFINGLLDKHAGRHYAKYGCWWNRDIEEIVEQAVERTPGLDIVKISRPQILQFGTLVRVELRVSMPDPAATREVGSSQ